MYRLFLSLRFLRHHWLMSLIGSFFVGASLVILVVVMSVMDGFQSKLKETLAGSSADLTLTPRWPCDPMLLSKALEDLCPTVEAAGPYYETITLTRRSGKQTDTREKMHYAAVYGVDAQRETRINRFGEYLCPLDPNRDPPRGLPTVRDPSAPFKVHDAMDAATGTIGVILGKGLAEDIGVLPNQRIRIAAAEPGKGGTGTSDPTDLSLKYVQVLVVGIYQSGNSEVDHSCIFMDHAAFRGLFDEDAARTSVRCRLTHFEQLDQAKTEIKKAMGQLIVRSAPAGVAVEPWQQNIQPETWKDKNRTLMQAIESEKSMILVIAFLIVIAGTSSIFAAQWLLVSDKIREIGILRALGANFNGVVSVFVLNGFLMGVIGSAGGALGGLLVVRNVDVVHGWISWLMGRAVFDPDIYYFRSIPTQVNPREVTNYALAALACTLVASAIPAIRAGLMNPAEALHRE